MTLLLALAVLVSGLVARWYARTEPGGTYPVAARDSIVRFHAQAVRRH